MKLKKKTTIIIDYLQLIQLNTSKTESRTQELSYITRELKLLAKKFKDTNNRTIPIES